MQGRFSNAPGYPLYTMGGWLWFHLGRALVGPDANPIAILSSYSVLWALVSLGLLYALILLVTDRGDGGNWPVAFLTTAFYGVTYFFWYYAVTTEQYASSVAWTLAVIWLAFRWERQRGERRERYLLGMAFLGGVALAHQLTLPIVLLPLLWFVLSGEPGLLRRPKLIAAAIGLMLLPLVSYAYVYAAGASHPEWRGAGQWASTWDWFWSFVSTSQGRSELTWSWTPLLTAEFPALIWRELTVPGLIAGLLGWITLGRRRAIVLYASLALYLVVCWIDRLGNWYQVIMPMYGLLALGIGAGADWLERRVGEWENGRVGERESGRTGKLAPPLSISRPVVPGRPALLPRRHLLSSSPTPAIDPMTRVWRPVGPILADDPPIGTAVFGTAAEQAALNYLTQIWGRRADLRTVTADQARAALSQGAPLAVTQAILPLAPQEISPDARYDALGRTLIALQREPDRAIPGGLQPWTHDFGPALQLLGGKAERNPTTGEMVVQLAWKAKEKPEPGLVGLGAIDPGRSRDCPGRSGAPSLRRVSDEPLVARRGGERRLSAYAASRRQSRWGDSHSVSKGGGGWICQPGCGDVSAIALITDDAMKMKRRPTWHLARYRAGRPSDPKIVYFAALPGRGASGNRGARQPFSSPFSIQSARSLVILPSSSAFWIAARAWVSRAALTAS